MYSGKRKQLILGLVKVNASARTKLLWWPDGVLNGHGDLMVSRMAAHFSDQ
jgi:hypothetical protein